MKKVLFLCLLSTSLLFSSCKSTEVLSSWHAKDIPSNCMSKVLVVSIMQSVEIKDRIEAEMVRQLSMNSGVKASVASDFFGPDGLNGFTEKEIVSKLEGSGYTSVMIISLLDRDKEEVYNPGFVYGIPDFGFYNRYTFIYDEVFTPGYYSTITNYVLMAEVYSIEKNTPIYSNHLAVYDPENKQSLASDFSKATIEDLRKQRLIR